MGNENNDIWPIDWPTLIAQALDIQGLEGRKFVAGLENAQSNYIKTQDRIRQLKTELDLGHDKFKALETEYLKSKDEIIQLKRALNTTDPPRVAVLRKDFAILQRAFAEQGVMLHTGQKLVTKCDEEGR